MSLTGTLRGQAVAVWRGAGALLSGRDVAAASATLTYFAGIAVVPWVLYAVWSTTWLRGTDRAEERLRGLEPLVPAAMGARPAFETVVHAGTHLDAFGAVIMLFPATFYGEGVRRACLQLRPERDGFTGWRARLALVPLVLVVAPLTWALLPLLEELAGLTGGGFGRLALRVVLGFTGLWLALAVVLTWVFRTVAPDKPRWWVCVAGGLATGSFLAGFLHGFQLFLAIPVDVGAPFGGIGLVGGVVAVGLWLYVLHAVFLVGWAATVALDGWADRRAGAAA